MKSIQRQLGVSLVAGTLALLLIAIGYAATSLSHEIEEGFDSALKEAAQRLLLVFELSAVDTNWIDESAEIGSAIPMGLPEPLKMHDLLLMYQIRNNAGDVIMRSRVANTEVFPDQFRAGYETRSAHRLYALQSSESRISIEVAEPMAHRSEALYETLVSFVLPLLLLIPLAPVLVWLVVDRSMASVQTMQYQIELRGESNLAPIAVEGLPNELKPIASSVNEMLERLKRALDAERNFATHSAHELRTPIASSLGQIQRQIRCLPAGAEQDRARQIESTLSSLARTSEKLMQLARAESGFLITDSSNNSFPIVEHVVTEFTRSSLVGDRLVLHVSDKPILITTLDEDGFAILLRNLIENGLKHGDHEADVQVIVDSVSNSLRVSNDCKVIVQDQLDKLRTRFVRGLTSASGSGLGLAIVDLIAQGAGTQVEFYSPVRGQQRGFEVLVQFKDFSESSLARTA